MPRETGPSAGAPEDFNGRPCRYSKATKGAVGPRRPATPLQKPRTGGNPRGRGSQQVSKRADQASPAPRRRPRATQVRNRQGTQAVERRHPPQARRRSALVRGSSLAAWRAAERDSERSSALSKRAAANFGGLSRRQASGADVALHVKHKYFKVLIMFRELFHIFRYKSIVRPQID